MQLSLVPLDAAAIALVVRDRSAFERAAGVALPAEWPHEELLEALPTIAAATTAAAPVLYLIVELAGAEAGARLVGDVGFHGPPSPDGEIEIGYAVIEAERRKGIATWAVRALLEIARARADVRSVVAACDADNEASIRVLRACGFEPAPSDDATLRWALR